MTGGSRICVVLDLPQDAMKIARLFAAIGQDWPSVTIGPPLTADDPTPIVVGATLIHVTADVA